MTSISIDLSKKIELRWLSELTRRIQSAAGSLPFFMIGAMARDLLLQHTHGIHTGRQTRDVDFAFHVETWAAFETVRSRLVDAGEFKEVQDVAHRLRFGNLIVDLVPFGAIEKADRTIAWPDDSTVMSVIGFREAFDSTILISLPGRVGLRVPNLAALTLLKLMAWEQRRFTAPKKDAHDLSLILRNYLNAGNQERLYTEAVHLLDRPDFDYEMAGAWLLGRDMSNLLAQDAREHVARLLDKEADPNGALRMVGDLSDDSARALLLIHSLRAGFREQPR